MAAANYNRPKPIDPLWYRQERTLTITCRCGSRETERVRDFQVRHLLPGDLRFYELAARLRCSACGARPEIEVG